MLRLTSSHFLSVDQRMITAPVSQTMEGMDYSHPFSERPGGFEAMHNKG